MLNALGFYSEQHAINSCLAGPVVSGRSQRTDWIKWRHLHYAHIPQLADRECVRILFLIVCKSSFGVADISRNLCSWKLTLYVEING